MTLVKSVIPTLLYNGSALVKGIGFKSDRVVGNPVQQARVYTNVRDVDELVLLDVRATIEGRGPSLDLIRQVSETCFVPLSYGGGVCTVEDAAACIEAGAERVVVSTHAVGSDLIERIADRFGCNAVTVAIDHDTLGGVAVRAGTVPLNISAERVAALAVQRGAGEVLLQSVARDGTLTGYDLEVLRRVRAAVSVRLIASGGCGTYAHMAEAFDDGADACAAGAMWTWTDQTPAGARAYLAERDYDVRPAMRPLEKVK